MNHRKDLSTSDLTVLKVGRARLDPAFVATLERAAHQIDAQARCIQDSSTVRGVWPPGYLTELDYTEFVALRELAAELRQWIARISGAAAPEERGGAARRLRRS
jgi:hypothetical protein